MTATVTPLFDMYYFARLVLHLVIVNIASFSLRKSVERRERQLFLLAKENLQRNIYAQELEAAKSRAEEADEVKMRFLANMSHEFRTPMSGVVQTLEVVNRTATGEICEAGIPCHRVQQRLSRHHQQHPRLHTLVSGRSSGRAVGHQRCRRGPPVVARHATAISRRRLALHLRLDLIESEDYVRADEVMLTEVLSNVLANAVKFTAAGRIDFGIELKSKAGSAPSAVSIEVVVSDTGIGIPTDAQPLVGTPFYQVDSASSRKAGGTGLGLAIVSRLVPAMGGSWNLSSTEGAGTIVRLSIPAEVASRPASHASGAPFRTLDFRHREIEKLAGTVLLVEDNELNAALANDLLSLMGLEVSLVTDGRQAVAAASTRQFDIILMDCQMPVMDGYAATRAIRSQEQGADPPGFPSSP